MREQHRAERSSLATMPIGGGWEREVTGKGEAGSGSILRRV